MPGINRQGVPLRRILREVRRYHELDPDALKRYRAARQDVRAGGPAQALADEVKALQERGGD